ncbi:MAG: putative lactoylglutathione lyase and related lyase [Frankiales bacterium]|nr:putative lactoylglutathione lyase and related lyase [Frankiales bacterium]
MGPLTQVCWVVDDIETAMKAHDVRWMHVPDVAFGPDYCTYRGRPADFVVHVAIGYSGAMQLELIQPVRGESLYTETGAGLHHVAWEPEDFDAAVAAAPEVVQQGSFPGVGMDFAYVPGGPLGSWVELMRLSPDMRTIFERLR